MKILFFEGAGCVPRGDVENCRIRTAFTNDKGVRIYLELSGMEVTKHTADRLKCYTNVAFVDHCHYINGGKYDYEDIVRDCERKVNFEYTKQEILNFVNNRLHCSFEQVIILDMFDGYRVHAGKGSYNFMEDFLYNPEKAAKARIAFEKIDMKLREQMGEKYSIINLHSIGESDLTVRCYADANRMRQHGLDPDNRYITVPL